ncbi:uncharacterized protein N7446_001386 [Penicillium canescens]|uniref:Elongation of fatty acids protein n=1 Tax=Penicillium canescens TaxID=5083 RepID=A0AAD6IC23_PENCN|nr:uncharacterized protein N7446_001386 [Penicillium canescens]KAJ6043190.1 hypothetical protein N7460_004545 [Penicillium canescens]KAJ6054665.1 hypothetical protein N7444_003763 [Penicillium canescens]KAJ6073609.1 hypothetical protein N7446_001386 [Penicillium canescens]
MHDFNVPTEMGQATVRIGLPPASLLNFPPNELPVTIPAPHVATPTWKQPFNIPNDLYNQVLDVRVPITIATVYALTVVLVNRINKSRGYKPYAFSNTRLFKLFVILHNVFLAVYSAWTFAGMLQAFRSSFPDSDDPHGLVGVVDSLCKINGPRGYGNAATYSPITNEWSIPNPAYHLTNGMPDSTDIGRLWNQGLAYFGWLFYLSKFYEVVDTVIILAKGKKSSTLQTYHHAGAMMCMWAGIRYMAPPIWIFCLVNSAIHAMMYTYYTITALRIRVPNPIKRSLTTMQITQFVFGTNMAAAYLFVHYTIPYPSGSPALSHLTQAAASAAASPVEAGMVPWLKKLAFRAAGAEGLAENVGTTGTAPIQESGYSHEMVTCMDTTGQAFAIWLNVSYLLPLTYLFARFFVRSYLNRKDPGVKQPTHMEAAEKAGMDALKSLSREIRRAAIEGENSEVTTDDEVLKAQVQKIVEKTGTADSPVRTRSTAATKAKSSSTSSSRSESEEGFSTVPAKKGAKKQKSEKSSAPSAPETKGENPFGVLGNDA